MPEASITCFPSASQPAISHTNAPKIIWSINHKNLWASESRPGWTGLVRRSAITSQMGFWAFHVIDSQEASAVMGAWRLSSEHPSHLQTHSQPSPLVLSLGHHMVMRRKLGSPPLPPPPSPAPLLSSSLGDYFKLLLSSIRRQGGGLQRHPPGLSNSFPEWRRKKEILRYKNKTHQHHPTSQQKSFSFLLHY